MKIKSFLITAVLATAILCSAGPAKVQAADNPALIAQLQAQIQSLIQQITNLQQQLAQIQGNSGVAWCHNFNTNLRVEDVNGDASYLKTALKKEGLQPYIDSNYTVLNNDFDEDLASAVVAFQEKYASEILTPLGLQHGTGFVGASTRAKLNKLYGCANKPIESQPTCQNLWWHDSNTTICQQKSFCGAFMYLGLKTFSTQDACNADLNNSTTQPSVTVTSPNGGEQWKIGETHNILWNGTNIPSNGKINIQLQGPSADYLFSDVNNSGSVSWTIPTTIQPGSYKIRIFCGQTGTDRYCSPDGSINSNPNSEDFSNGNFTINSSATPVQPATQPSISYITPTSGGPGNIITIYGSNFVPSTTVKIMKDGFMYTNLSNVYVSPTELQVTIDNTFFVNMDAGVTYQFVAANSNGTSNSANFTLTSSSQPTQPTNQASITVTSPNGGETLKAGTYYNIKWSTTGLSSNATIHVQLQNDDLRAGGRSLVETKNVGSYNWLVTPYEADLNNHNYFRIEVIVEENNITKFDESDNYFSIVAATTQPSITITPQIIPSNGSISLTISPQPTSPWTLTFKCPASAWVTNGGCNEVENWSQSAELTQNFQAVNQANTNQTITAVATINGQTVTASFTVQPANIAQPSITVTSPNGGETWKIGETHNITWASTGVNNVMIELDKNNPNAGWHLVYSAPASVGSYSWTIPSAISETLSTASDYKIKIWDTTNASVTDSSDNYFTIVAPVSTTAIYRYYNSATQDHFYVVAGAEKDKVEAQYPSVWTSEGIAFYAYGEKTAETVPVYRLYNLKNGNHFYTSNEAEKSKLINNYPDTWAYEKIAFYAYSYSQSGLAPVYRLYDSKDEAHFYTANEAEKNKLLNLYPNTWALENIAFYVYANSATTASTSLDIMSSQLASISNAISGLMEAIRQGLAR